MPVLSTISQDKDEYGFIRSEKYKTELGYELAIQPAANGLYEIVPMSGGKRPRVCDEMFTSHLKARKALIAYIESKDILGYGEHPERAPRARKTKVDEPVSDN